MHIHIIFSNNNNNYYFKINSIDSEFESPLIELDLFTFDSSFE